MPKLPLTITVTALLAASPGLSAQDSGFYLGVSYGVAETDYTIEPDAGAGHGLDPSDSLSDKDNFYSFDVGYQASSHVSIELSHMETGTFEERIQIDPRVFIIDTTNDLASVEASVTSLSVLVEYPVYKAVSLVGKLGYSLADIDSTLSGDIFGRPVSSSESEDGVNYGAGLNFAVGDCWSARLLWNRYETGPLEFDATGLSVSYHF